MFKLLCFGLRATQLYMGRWDPVPSNSAYNDLMADIAAAQSGQLVEGTTMIEVPRGAGIDWGSDLSFVGVYVRDVASGSPAEARGVRPGLQLVAVNGTRAYDLDFDRAMSLMGNGPVKLEFYDGSRDDLLQATGTATLQDQVVAIRVMDKGRRVAEIQAGRGANLRDELVRAGIDVYKGTTKWTNCNGKQLCGTCIVDVTRGANNTNFRSNDEAATLRLQNCAPSTRLSCVTFVYGDLTVGLQPDRSGFFGSATSGSGW